MSRYINIVKDRNEKLCLTHIRPFQIALAILIEIKNLGVLETLIKTQFHHTNLNLTNSKSWTNWQVFHLMRLNLNVNVTLIPNLVIQFPFSTLC